MAVPVTINHREQGKSRLLHIFKDKPSILALLDTYMKQYNSLELVVYQLLETRNLSDLESVDGVYLDEVGDIVGESRLGRSDADYRRGITLRIGVNNTQATPNYLMQLLKSTTESDDVRYYPHYPASYSLEFNGDQIPEEVLMEFTDASLAGVRPCLIHNKDDLGWIPCEVGDTTTESVLPETSETSGIGTSEVYIDDTGLVGSAPVFIPTLLTSSYSNTNHTGNSSTTLVVNNGLDLTDDKSVLIWWGESTAYVHNFYSGFNPATASGGSIGSSRDWYQSSQYISPKEYCDIVNTSTGFTESSSATVTDINITSVEYHVHTLKRKADLIDIVEYTGDGSLSQSIPHIIDKPIAYMSITAKDGTGGIYYWFRGMGSGLVINNRFDLNVGAILGGGIPTNNKFTVGDTGSNGLNFLDKEYVALLIAYNPEEGITSGSYISTGVAGQEVDVGNSVGLLNIYSENAPSDSNNNCFYGRSSGSTGKSANSFGALLTDELEVINKDNRYIVLGDQNTYTNWTSGSKHYWFNIADPSKVINPV